MKEWAIYFKRAIVAVKSGRNVWDDPLLRQKIMGLSARPRDDFDGWFHVAWAMYFDSSLEGNLKNDAIMARKADIALGKAITSKSKGHLETPETNIRKRLKAAAKLEW